LFCQKLQFRETTTVHDNGPHPFNRHAVQSRTASQTRTAPAPSRQEGAGRAGAIRGVDTRARLSKGADDKLCGLARIDDGLRLIDYL
jgi:hypothetical protein